MDRDEAGPEPAVTPAEPATEATTAPDVEPFELPSHQQIDQAEKELQGYMVLKRRGSDAAATKALDEAQRLAPGYAQVILMVAKDLVERGQRRKANDLLKRGLATHPKNPDIERLYAETVLALSPHNALEDLTSVEVMARGKVAAILTVLVPGLGQIVTGRVKLGLGFLVVWGVCWIWAFLIPNGLTGLASVMGLNRGSALDFNATVLLPLFFAMGAHFSAIADSTVYAKRFKPRTIERPVPPVDKPF